MSGVSSSAAGWSSLLEPSGPPTDLVRRPDDPRLGEIVEFWNGDPAAIQPGRPVLLGFPQDEGIRRNYGRPGCAAAPREIRRWLYRLTPWHPGGYFPTRTVGATDLRANPPLDIGNVRISGSLEESQEALGCVLAELLKLEAVPLVLGGGHETAYGHYLGYVRAGKSIAVINIDAHLDVRPLIDGRGHSGSPFRQMLEHPTHPLPGPHYYCVGLQPGSVSRAHWQYAQERGCVIEAVTTAGHPHHWLLHQLQQRIAAQRCKALVTVDADAFAASDVPGVSAPNLNGFPGQEAYWCAVLLGESPLVSSFELVEITPCLDRDGQSARWAALVLWHFLIGLALRARDQT